MLNRCSIMGRLTRDPETRSTQGGSLMASFCLACDRDYKDKATGDRQADFINVVAWGNTASFAGKYLSKGQMVVADGRLQVRSYTDKDGNRRTVSEVAADHLYFASSRRDADAGPIALAPDQADLGDGGQAPCEEESGLPF